MCLPTRQDGVENRDKVYFCDLKPANEGGNLFSFDAAIGGWVGPQLLWCRKLPVLI